MTPTTRVWITGAGGLIGASLLSTAVTYAPEWTVFGATRADVDLTDAAAVRALFQQLNPDLVIHCAGITKAQVCEGQPQLAYQVNVVVTAQLAELARDHRLIFFSTDLVFDGEQGNYDEASPVHPLNAYGRTKCAAEACVLAHPNHVVIRTSLTGGVSPTRDRGFNEEMQHAWRGGRMLKLFTDEYRCPMAAVVTARAVWEVARQNVSGVYHLAGAERLSRWEIGQLLARRWPQLTPLLEPASRRDYVGPRRPADTSLNCAKIQSRLSFHLPGLSEWLAAHPDEPF